MAITNGYVTLVEMYERLGIGVDDVLDMAYLEDVIEGVSRWIDQWCGQRFFTTAADEVRYFTPEWFGELMPNLPLLSIAALETDDDGDGVYENTWAAADYALAPYNASLDGKPYLWVETTPNGDYSFPVGVVKGVKLTGKFGYSTTAPKPVKEACTLQCERLFLRKDAPFGVLGSADMGQLMVLPKLDPDVQILLSGYRRVSR